MPLQSQQLHARRHKCIMISHVYVRMYLYASMCIYHRILYSINMHVTVYVNRLQLLRCLEKAVDAPTIRSCLLVHRLHLKCQSETAPTAPVAGSRGVSQASGWC